MFDELHEECGVFGAYEVDDAATLTYYGLHSLQHRGQEASGIAARDEEIIHTHKGKGLTIDVFSKEDLQNLPGRNAIGHVRYSTAGGQEIENIQPITARGKNGYIAIVHNGQIVNEKLLRAQLEEEGAIFQGTSDSEVILHLIQKEQGTLKERVAKAAAKLEGAFSFLVMDGQDMFALRDKHGLRPLCYAKYQDGYLISSESCAFEINNLHEYQDVKPGQMLCFHNGLCKKEFYTRPQPRHLCAMEYIYFARPDSTIDGINVHAFRRKSGQYLGWQDKSDGFQADLVIGVPDSSLSAAIGYARAMDIPLETGLVKNRFVTRTFIQPTQAMRDQGVKLKLSAISKVVAGKKIVMVDDSIVRGTTSRRIVNLLRDAGAREVHVRIASPALCWPCFYGVDMSTKKELIANQMPMDHIADAISADSLRYLSHEDLKRAGRPNGLCTACFDGSYCTELYSYQAAIEEDVCES